MDDMSIEEEFAKAYSDFVEAAHKTNAALVAHGANSEEFKSLHKEEVRLYEIHREVLGRRQAAGKAGV